MRPVDVEGLLVDALEDAHTKIPKPRPVGFTRVTRAGGSTLNQAQSRPRVLVESWDETSVLAFQRNADAWAAIYALDKTMVGDVWVAEVELTEPVNFPDSETSSPRYQFVAQLTVSRRDA